MSGRLNTPLPCEAAAEDLFEGSRTRCTRVSDNRALDHRRAGR